MITVKRTGPKGIELREKSYFKYPVIMQLSSYNRAVGNTEKHAEINLCNFF